MDEALLFSFNRDVSDTAAPCHYPLTTMHALGPNSILHLHRLLTAQFEIAWTQEQDPIQRAISLKLWNRGPRLDSVRSRE